MLKRIQEPEAWEPQINQTAFEALDMAIEALSQESSEDVISRQAAIEIIQSMYPGMPRVPWMRKDWQKRYEPYIRTENAIRKLPSAQSDIAEKLYLCKCYVTDEEGFQHEVIHTGDIRRITGWEI